IVRELARHDDPRSIASVTASGQPVDICGELVATGDPVDAEFLTCLVQELVLRVEALDREPFLGFWRGVCLRRHPLGWLPLRLTAVEASISLPSYAGRGTAYR